MTRTEPSAAHRSPAAPPSSTEDKLLDIRGLSVDYGIGSDPVHAVDRVDLLIRRGEVVGLAGESGSGKSTLAYAISRLLRDPGIITGGEVFFYEYPQGSFVDKVETAARHDDADRSFDDGRSDHGRSEGIGPLGGTGIRTVDLLSDDKRVIRAVRWSEIAVVFQSALQALNPVMRIGKVLDDVLKAHFTQMSKAERRARAQELLRIVGISPDRLRSYPHELSGGMRQRVMIAVALALDPSLLIMDEPTTALDVVIQREILEELMDLRERLGFSILFITHDLSLLIEIADAIAVMYAGRLIEQASAKALFHAPRHPYTYGLTRSFPSLHGDRRTMAGIPGSPPDLRQVPSGCAFHPRCAWAMEECRTTTPPMVELHDASGSREVLCWLHDGEHDVPPELSQVPPAAGTLAAQPSMRVTSRASRTPDSATTPVTR